MAIHRLAQMMWDVLRGRAASRSASRKGRHLRPRLELTHLEERTLLATASGTIVGNAFIDANRNGVFNVGERALNGVQIFLNGRNNGVLTSASLITDANGHYRFDNVPAGTFTISGATGFIPNFGNLSSNVFGGFTARVGVLGGHTRTRNLAFRGIAPYYISLRQFLPINVNTVPFGPAGSGVADAQPRENNAPTLNTTRKLYGTTAADLNVFATNGGVKSSLDLSGFFSDADMSNSTVQIIASVGTTKKTINVNLFDNAAPQTVANFVNYILANRYDNSIFHRFSQTPLPDNTKQNFVLQGGGFTASTSNSKTTLTDLSTNDPAVQNEFSADRSNTLGTLAMAKLGDNPNSATSEFFFNLNDNSSNLNNQNEGFTVFGQLASQADRDAVNALIAASASTPRNLTAKVNVDGTSQLIPFSEIPLGSSTNTNNFPDNAKLADFVRIEDVKVTNRPESFKYKVVSVKPLNGAPAGTASLISSATIKDNRLNILTKAGAGTGEYEVTVRAVDRFGASVDAKFHVKVGAAPVAAGVNLSSNSPGTNDTLIATVNAPALNGLPASYDFVWKTNGQIMKVETTSGSSAFDLSGTTNGTNNGDVGNFITVTVTPHLRNVDGAAVSASATVGSNSNAPTITSPSTASVVENTPSSTTVLTVTATDPNNDPVTFAIAGGLDADKFNLTANGVLTFKTSPDFETPGSAAGTNSYQVVVKASDNSATPNSSTQTITINVTNAPLTFTSPTTALVAENTTKVITVVADSTEDGKPAYRVSGGADADKFTIDKDTGELSFKTAPNFEANGAADNSNNYKVQVSADDGKGGTASQSLTVTVTNAGVQFTSPSSVSVPQNTTAVVTVTADSSEPGTPTLTLTGGADKDLFNFTNGALSFKTAPTFNDPNHGNNYVVVITADDGLGGTATQTINITVTNGAVTFANPTSTNTAVTLNGTSATVPENNAAATSNFIKVSATSTAANPNITYNLSGPDAVKFTLSATGELKFVATPDFDAQNSANGNNVYQVVVTANDGQGGVAIQTITVTVTNAPVNITSPNTASVPENTTAVLTVAANSTDGTPTFKITGGADQGKFTINATTGELSFTTAPNFEAKASAAHNNTYKVDVTANDGHGGTSTQTITVTVTNGPTITSANTFSVVENTTAVGTVTTTPGDGAVTFSLTGGVDRLKFTINSTTGALSFKVAPDFEAQASAAGTNAYKVVVTATDSTGSKDARAITVNVTNGPEITSAATASVPENTTAVLTVTTTPPDGTRTFTLTGGADKDLFDIDSNGALTFKVAPNFEAPGSAANSNTYLVEVTVADASGNDVQAITVTVTNVNEAPTAANANLSATENGSPVTTGVLTDDEDSDDSPATLTYNVTQPSEGTASSNGDGTFTFNPGTGFQGLAAGETTQVTFKYTATDSHAAVSPEATVTVTVTGVNDAPTAQNANLSAAEDGASVTTPVLADDVDSDNAPGNLTYAITQTPAEGSVVSNGDGTFTFSPGSAFQDLAVGQTRQVTFKYTATDIHNAASPEATVTVTVTGVNDNPVATDNSYDVNSDSVVSGNVITDIVADSDLDTGDNLVVSAAVDSGNNAITLGSEFVLPSGAKLTLNPNGTFSYDATTRTTSLQTGETATELFTYTVSDPHGGTATATVTFTITGV